MSCARKPPMTSECVKSISSFMIFSGSHGREDELLKRAFVLAFLCTAVCFPFWSQLLRDTVVGFVSAGVVDLDSWISWSCWPELLD